MSGLGPKRKPRDKPGPYNRQPKRPKPTTNAPKTSAKPNEKSHRENLTLHDWLTVFTYMDTHPNMVQGDIVRHFATRIEGALVFTQSTLSWKVKSQDQLQAWTESNPNALSGKCARVVTRPDVERALVLWVKHMEKKRETVNGPMLRVKREKFEAEFGVPENERLRGDGWVASFCKAYKIKEYRRHGEADSVDLAAVAAECMRVQAILAKYPPRDR